SDSLGCAAADEADEGGFAVAELAGDFFASAAACTSSAVIVPSGPVPLKPLVSTPNSFARRRALGEICEDVCVAAMARSVTGVTLVALAEGAAVAFGVGSFSPAARSHAIVSPTGITAPSWA